MKTADIINGIDSLKILMNCKLPAKASYRLVLFTKEVESVLSSFNETRTNLLEKYGKRKEDGTYDIKDSKKFQKEMTEVLEEEVDIKNPEITIDMIERVEIEPSVLSNLYFIIKDDD